MAYQRLTYQYLSIPFITWCVMEVVVTSTIVILSFLAIFVALKFLPRYLKSSGNVRTLETVRYLRMGRDLEEFLSLESVDKPKKLQELSSRYSDAA